MALNGSKQAIVVHRRECVARLRLRGYSMREIQEELAGDPKTLNPGTSQPWCKATIGYDCKALDAQWLEVASIETDQHKANVLAEIKELKRAGWSKEDLDLVLKAIKRECDLRGLDAPIKTDMTTKGESLNDASWKLELERRLSGLVAVTDEAGVPGEPER